MADGASGAVAADQVAGAYLLGPAVSVTQSAADGVGIGVEADQFHASLGRGGHDRPGGRAGSVRFRPGRRTAGRIRGVVKAETEQPDPDDTTAGVELDPYGVVAPANTHDSPLLAPTLETLAGLGPLPAQPTVHLGPGYDSGTSRTTLAERGLDGHIAHKGTPAPIQGQQAVAGGAHPRVGQRVRQAPLVHRAAPTGGQVPPSVGPRDHHRASAGPPVMDLLPLAGPSRRP
jgi:hypothetical protein